MSKPRAAVVGVGYLGRFHAQKYKNNPDVELVAVCDGRAGQAAAVAQELNTKAVNDPKQLIGSVDLVTVAANTQAHYDLGLMFLEAGIAVNMEKPLAATVDQARRMFDLAERKKVPLATGHIERFNPCIVELKREMKSPQFIELIRHTAFRARGADVSVLHDLMIHDIDLLLWLSGSNIRSMQAWGHRLIGSSIDVAEVFVEMESGQRARLSASRVSSRPVRAIRVVEQSRALYADTGVLELETIEPVDLNAAEPMKISKRVVEKKDALQLETDAFIAAVKNGTAPVVSGRDGLRALEVVEKIEALLGGGR